MSSSSLVSAVIPANIPVKNFYSGASVTRTRTFFGISAWYTPWNALYSAHPPTTDFSFNRYCFVSNTPNIIGSWGMCNYANGVYDWSALDAWVNFHFANGTELVYSLGAPCPLWLTPGSTHVSTDTATTPSRQWCKEYPATSAYATWVQAVGQRYNGKIKYWFVANEPDINNGEYIDTVQKLAEMTRLTSQILKNINSHNVIIGPELSNINMNAVSSTGYLQSFLSASAVGYDAGFGTGAGTTGKDWIDYVSFHPYTNNFSNILDPYANVTTGSDGLNNYTRLKSVLASYGLSAKPLWASELMMLNIATPTLPSPTGSSPVWTWNLEYAFLMRSALIAAAHGVAKFTWFSTGGSSKPYLRNDIAEGDQARAAIHQLMAILSVGFTALDYMNDTSLRVTMSDGSVLYV